MACRGSGVRVSLAPLNFSSHTKSFQTAFSNNITFVRTCPSLFKQFCTLKCTYKNFICCRNENFNLGWYHKKINQIKTWLWLVCSRHRKTKLPPFIVISIYPFWRGFKNIHLPTTFLPSEHINHRSLSEYNCNSGNFDKFLPPLIM